MSIEKADVVATIGKGLVGAIPFVGPLAAEIVGMIIPNQRIDRIESTLKLLESKILESDKEKVKQRIVTPEYVDLMEDGFWQAARALSEERKDYIASLLKNSFTDDEIKYLEYKRLMFILSELNDFEILILKLESLKINRTEYSNLWKIHKDSFALPLLTVTEATPGKVAKETIHNSHWFHLTDLGLLKRRFKRSRTGTLPEFDQETGMIKSEGYDITRLGKLLLRSIDQAASESNT
ncbi:MAG: hypothetical protein ACTFAL_11490 [Candidatus Electronema sp. V4]|uniref:hypothetical protein n=1 Tax=Candidatus Electronema sp. V4 TaxID=3454756 RepID=UPI0040557DCC